MSCIVTVLPGMLFDSKLSRLITSIWIWRERAFFCYRLLLFCGFSSKYFPIPLGALERIY